MKLIIIILTALIFTSCSTSKNAKKSMDKEVVTNFSKSPGVYLNMFPIDTGEKFFEASGIMIVALNEDYLTVNFFRYQDQRILKDSSPIKGKSGAHFGYRTVQSNYKTANRDNKIELVFIDSYCLDKSKNPLEGILDDFISITSENDGYIKLENNKSGSKLSLRKLSDKEIVEISEEGRMLPVACQGE